MEYRMIMSSNNIRNARFATVEGGEITAGGDLQ
jgi:hypothetical protein